MNYIKSLVTLMIPVLAVVYVDFQSFSKARKSARANGEMLPDFDWQVAWPRYVAGLLGGILNLVAADIPLDPIEL